MKIFFQFIIYKMKLKCQEGAIHAKWTEMIGKGTEAELAVKTKATGSGDSGMFQEVDEPPLM